MRRIYIVDTENVKSEGYEGITALSHTDEVILFTTKNSNNVSVETAIDISNSRAQIKKVIGSTGTPNALDFQIIAYLGVRIAKIKNTDEIYIISGDKGFDVAIRFLKNHFEKENIHLIKAIHYSLNKEDSDIKSSLIRERMHGYYKNETIETFIEKYMNNKDESLEALTATVHHGLYDRLSNVI